MPSIVPSIAEAAFDPETLAIMSEGYDCAWLRLRDGGAPDAIKLSVAKHVVAHAIDGERDPKRLCEEAVLAFRGTIDRRSAVAG